MNYFLNVPEQVKISLTNICNYKCTMCPNQHLRQKRGYISDDLVFKILDECAELGVKKISLGGTGEPLVHKNFIKYLKRAKALGFSVSTTSNCSLMNRGVAEGLLSEGLDRLCISIYSSDEKSHYNYTGTDLFLEAVDNIQYFLKLWKEKGNIMEVNMWFLSIPGVNDQVEFLKYWEPIANDVGLSLSIKQPINWGGKIDIYGEDISKARLYINKNPSGYEIVNRRKIRCDHVRSYLFILHDGSVVPCCNIQEADEKGIILFGDINHEKIVDIWNGPKYMSFKKSHYNKNITNFPYCKDCSETIAEVKWQLNLMHYFRKYFKHI